MNQAVHTKTMRLQFSLTRNKTGYKNAIRLRPRGVVYEAQVQQLAVN